MSLFGFILVSDITVFQATVKSMEQGGEVEENNKKVEYDGEVEENNKKVGYENLFNQSPDCNDGGGLGW